MISEIDIRDFERSEQPVKLYEVPRNSIVTICSMDSSDLPIHFSHIDGAYSYCWELNKPHHLIHLAAWQQVFTWKKKNA